MKKVNTIFNSSLDATKNNRYCTICHLRLEPSPKDKYIYTCPRCNVGQVNIYNTEPSEKLVTTFPTANPYESTTNKKYVHQATSERLSRSKYFQQKRILEKNKVEAEDPYLKELMKRHNSQIKITNIEYNDPAEEY